VCLWAEVCFASDVADLILGGPSQASYGSEHPDIEKPVSVPLRVCRHESLLDAKR
jgi:hypothetical protein